MSGTKTAADWLPKAEAAALLGVSYRQLERRAKAGYVQTQYAERGPTESAAAALYSRADIEALKAGKPNVHARVVPQAERAGLPQQPVLQKSDKAPPSPLMSQDYDLLAVLAAIAKAGAQPAPRPWLTLDEAVAYSGLPAGYLVAKAREGWAAAVDVAGGGSRARWRFSRDGLAKGAGA